MTGLPGALDLAARAYGLDPHHLTPVASAYRPAAAWRAGAVLLKPYRYTEQQLFYVTRALLHLERRGFGQVPRLVHARSGRPYVRAGGGWWYATTWIDGRPVRFPEELPAAAGALASFHTASEGELIPWHPSRSWPRRWQLRLADLQTFQRLAREGSTPFDRAYAHVAPHYLRQAQRALEALERSDYHRLEEAARRRTGFCHRDCTPGNLVVNPGGDVCLVDPDTWGAELRLHDLVRLLLTGAGNDPAAALGAMAAYEEAAPLDPAERRLLPVALSLPREYWWAGLCRYRRDEPGVDPEQALREALEGAPVREAWVRRMWEALG
jgi:CotS family spore coat protein